jgi:hypothetical protein
MYIQNFVGLKEDGQYGDMYFTQTLSDWSKFDINKRTKYDAAISSGLAIMACNKHLYAPSAKNERQQVNISFTRYDNEGSRSRIINKYG